MSRPVDEILNSEIQVVSETSGSVTTVPTSAPRLRVIQGSGPQHQHQRFLWLFVPLVLVLVVLI